MPIFCVNGFVYQFQGWPHSYKNCINMKFLESLYRNLNPGWINKTVSSVMAYLPGVSAQFSFIVRCFGELVLLGDLMVMLLITIRVFRDCIGAC